MRLHNEKAVRFLQVNDYAQLRMRSVVNTLANGFKPTKQRVKWLTVEEHINYGIQENTFDD